MTPMIRFVLNVPMYVKYAIDHETEESSSEDEDLTFNEELFKFNATDPASYPFRTYNLTSKARRVGDLENFEELKLKKGGNLSSNAPSQPQQFLALLECSAFRLKDINRSLNELAVVIGLNRPKSLSKRRNEYLRKQLLNTNPKKAIRNKKNVIRKKMFAFFWNIPWTDREGSEVQYEKVRKFYRQLKRKDPQTAEKFLIYNEDAMCPLPPYQNIRECIKSHRLTEDIIKHWKFKYQNTNLIIYYSFIDGDTKSFNGIYSAYRCIVQKAQRSCKPPIVMSTGFEFNIQDGYPLLVGSKLERLIRTVTSRLFGPGVYYPEPNFCVLLPNDENILPYSFVDKKQKDGKMESPILIRNILKCSTGTMRYYGTENALITDAVRAKFSSIRKQGLLRFSSLFCNEGIPNSEDLNRLKLIIQSTLNPKKWAEMLYCNRGFTVRGAKGVKGRFVYLMTVLISDDSTWSDVKHMLLEIIPQGITICRKLRDASKQYKLVTSTFLTFPHTISTKFKCPELIKRIVHEFYSLEVGEMIKIIEMLHSFINECFCAISCGCTLQQIVGWHHNIQTFKLLYSVNNELIPRFFNFLEDYPFSIHRAVTKQFYMLTKEQMERLLCTWDNATSECYRAIDAEISLTDVVSFEDLNLFKILFSCSAEKIVDNADVTYNDILDLWKLIQKHNGSVEDLKELLQDESGLFLCGTCFLDIQFNFLRALQSSKRGSAEENDEDDEDNEYDNDSLTAYEQTVHCLKDEDEDISDREDDSCEDEENVSDHEDDDS